MVARCLKLLEAQFKLPVSICLMFSEELIKLVILLKQ